MDEQETLESVREYYGKVLQSTESLQTSACTAFSAPHPVLREMLKKVPRAVRDKFYGCGTAVPLGIEGLAVADLGSGSGQDCYIAAQLVGPKGRVVGVDMTAEQVQVARASVDELGKTLGWQPQLFFVEGYIEKLPLESSSLDVVISNCVVNLSPRKDLVLKEAYRVLREGGEMHFSDVYCDRRLPASVRQHKLLWGECIAGALYLQDFLRLCHSIGFSDPRQVESREIAVASKFDDVVGNARFFSRTYRLFKLPPGRLETLCEDYGQTATYLGTLAHQPHRYRLDDHHLFETGRLVLVCGNTASMLQETWLAKHFRVTGDRSTHFGLFDCSSPPQQSAGTAAAEPSPCSTGACC